MSDEKNEKSKNVTSKKIYDQEEIEDLKESYKLGKEYYKNIETKIEKTRK